MPTMYQGSGAKFDKYDMSFIGTGDNTAFEVKGHHFSPSRKVADFYAQRIQTDNPTYINEVSLKGNFIDRDANVDPDTVQDYVCSYYGDELFDELVEHIFEMTDHDADYDQAHTLATSLLTGNESQPETQDLLDDVNYGGWDMFQAEHNEKFPSSRLDIPIDYGNYVDVGRMLYSSVLLRFDNDYDKTHKYLTKEFGIDGMEYDNFGNIGAENVRNIVVWNDDAITLLEQNLAYEPRPAVRMAR